MSKKQSEVRLRLASALLLEGGSLELYVSPQKLARFTAWRIIASSAHHSAEYTPLVPIQRLGERHQHGLGFYGLSESPGRRREISKTGCTFAFIFFDFTLNLK